MNEISGKNKNNGQIVGIDLGTTNSTVAIEILNIEVISNCDGDDLTPSVVSFIENEKESRDEGKYNVGKEALNQKKMAPESTAYATKRLIGRNFYSKEIQNYLQKNTFTYKVEEQKDSVGEISITLSEKQHSPEEISAQILKKIKKDGEKFLKREIGQAVITVPAYFNDKAKYATLKAAKLAGLEVKRLLPEPTAAAISFDICDLNSKDKKDGETVLVYDFGGGTFDCSILNIVDGHFIEMGKSGDMWLGGDDIDQLIFQFTLEETAKEHELSLDELKELVKILPDRERLRFQSELTQQAEQAKIKLSKCSEVYISILGLLKSKNGELIDLDVILTREKFGQLITPMIENTIGICEKLIESLGLTKDLIDHYFLVGGTVQIPEIVDKMKEAFSINGADNVIVSDDPMRAIAKGAAIMANRLNQVNDQKQKFEVIHSASHDYYLELANGKELLVVEKNAPLPHFTEHMLRLQDKDQNFVHFRFYNKVNKQKEYIGDLWLSFDLRKEMSDKVFNKSTYEQFDKIQQQLFKPANLILKVEIDENNLFKINVHLKEFPDIKISKTLSRGKYEERIYLDIENEIKSNLIGREIDKVKLKDACRIFSYAANRIDYYLEGNNGIWPGKKSEDKINQFIQLAKDILKSNNSGAPVDLIDFVKQLVGLNYNYIPKRNRQEILRRVNNLEETYHNEATLEKVQSAADDLNDYINNELYGPTTYHSMKRSISILRTSSSNSNDSVTLNCLIRDSERIRKSMESGDLKQADDLACQFDSNYSYKTEKLKSTTFHKDVELV